MFIDYVALMLVNTAAGLAVLACYLYWGLTEQDQGHWVPAFLVPGSVSVMTGLHMISTWPLPGPYSSAFGELSVLFGSLMVGAALAMWKGWNKIPLGIYGFFAGLYAMVAGVRFIDLHLTQQPIITGTAFILSGLGGIFSLPMLYMAKNRKMRIAGAIVLLAAAGLLGLTAYLGFWMHMDGFAKWLPATMQK